MFKKMFSVIFSILLVLTASLIPIQAKANDGIVYGPLRVTGVIKGTPESVAIPLGDISATSTKTIFSAHKAVMIKRINVTSSATLATSDSAYFTFGVTNKGTDGSGSTSIVSASTNANKTTTAGAGLTAYVKRALTLGTSLNVVKDSVLTMTITKSGSPANLTDVVVYIDYIGI